jgi:hypothetical protein
MDALQVYSTSFVSAEYYIKVLGLNINDLNYKMVLRLIRTITVMAAIEFISLWNTRSAFSDLKTFTFYLATFLYALLAVPKLKLYLFDHKRLWKLHQDIKDVYAEINSNCEYKERLDIFMQVFNRAAKYIRNLYSTCWFIFAAIPFFRLLLTSQFHPSLGLFVPYLDKTTLQARIIAYFNELLGLFIALSGFILVQTMYFSTIFSVYIQMDFISALLASDSNRKKSLQAAIQMHEKLLK